MDISIDLDVTKLDLLEKKIVEMGRWATGMQSSLHIAYKADSSPVTEVDLGISEQVISLIKQLFPGCGIITEEEEVEEKSDPPYTFVLDPIDGTDMYSQGLPSFCIALGILDSTFLPVGAILYAPRFGRGTTEGMLIRLNPGEQPTINGKPLTVTGDSTKKKQITLSASLLNRIDFTHFEGKFRSFGSQILQVLAPSVFMNISASINEPCYVWDYAAAHAVLLSLGMDLFTPDGKPFRYSQSFLSRNRAGSITYGGYGDTVGKLLKLCPPLHPDKPVIHY